MPTPRLLRETAEIALTEIKRFLEPRLMETLNLRRVSAPLYLPAGSPLLVKECPGVRITLPHVGEVEIVATLDGWLRNQLATYDIAPGFGVYTIMNALRPTECESATSSPHVAAWSWQQTVKADADLTDTLLVERSTDIYTMLAEAERMILHKFPHLTRTLADRPEVVHPDQLRSMQPDLSPDRIIYDRLHPVDEPHLFHSEEEMRLRQLRSLIVITDSTPYCPHRSAIIYAWNHMLGRPVRLAVTSLFPACNIAPASVGGTIYRSCVALQLLHLTEIL